MLARRRAAAGHRRRLGRQPTSRWASRRADGRLHRAIADRTADLSPAADDLGGRRGRRPATRGPRTPRAILAPGGFANQARGLAGRPLGRRDRRPRDRPARRRQPDRPGRAGRRQRGAPAVDSPRTSTGPIGNWTDTRPERLDGLGPSRPRLARREDDRRHGPRPRAARGRIRVHAWTPAVEPPAHRPAVTGDIVTHTIAAGRTPRRRLGDDRRTSAPAAPRAMELMPRSSCPATSRAGGRARRRVRLAATASRRPRCDGSRRPARAARSRPGWRPRRRTRPTAAADRRRCPRRPARGMGAGAPRRGRAARGSAGLPGRSSRTSAARRSYGRDWIRPAARRLGRRRRRRRPRRDRPRRRARARGPGRLGVLGLSYGGFMVNWLVGTTDRFRAAVSDNGVTNQVSRGPTPTPAPSTTGWR